MKYFILLFLLFNITAKAQQFWRVHTIDNSSNGADGVKLADINKDGKTDIVTGWEESGITKLYLHPKDNKVKKKWPSIILGQTPNVEDAVFVDMNSDGELDIVCCSEKGTEAIFVHLNEQNNSIYPKKWKQEILPASKGKMMWMYAEPINVDSKNGMDLVAAGKGENGAIGWFEAPENSSDLNDWKWHKISDVGWIMSIIKRDMDKDGDTDLVITDRYGEKQGARWLENPGAGNTQKQIWKSNGIGADNLEVMFMCMADLDGDGAEEAVVAERTGNTIKIFKNLNNKGKQWSEQSIPLPEFTGLAKSVEVGDINNDSIFDLVVSTNTGTQKKNGLIWLNGKKLYQTGENDWKIISEKHLAKYDKVELTDIDNDGDLDILICEENFGKKSVGLGVVWYENPAIIKTKSILQINLIKHWQIKKLNRE